MTKRLSGIKKVFSGIRNFPRATSIQSIIALSFTAVTILSIIFVSLALSQMFSDSAEKNAVFNTQQIMDQVNLNLNTYFKGMMEISDLIRSRLKADTENNENTLSNILEVTSGIRKDIAAVAIYSKDGTLVTSYPKRSYNENFSAADQEWFKNSINDPTDFFFLPPHVQTLFEDERPWVVSLCRGSTFYDKEQKATLTTVVDMNFSSIEELCSRVSLGKRGYVYIIDKSGNIIYHPQQQILYVGLKNENIADALNKEPGSYFENFQGEKRIMTIKNISYTGWKMVGISYVNELVTDKKYFLKFFIYITLFAIVFGTMASLFVSAKVSKPIKQLEKQMRKVENGNFDINFEVKGEDEVKHLSKTFNIMVAKIKQLMGEIIKEQEEKRKSELKALQAQINPHFLYNTLDSIVWMNENHNYEGVTVMVAALAKLFRISISRGNEVIRIADEIEHARNYLIIQKIRYKDKFDFTIEAEPDLLQARTLKLILQPIIENAIYHGVGPISEKGEIQISVTRDEDIVLFKISDNGYGIKPEVLKELLSSESKSPHSDGVGLKNVNERIKLYFGKEYGIQIESEIDVGTTVNIRIPFMTNGLKDGGKNGITK